jgi:phenylalanyl-tRNA synthetase beta subunit
VPEGHRSLTLRVVQRPIEATLTAAETGVIRNHMLAALSQELGAHLR